MLFECKGPYRILDLLLDHRVVAILEGPGAYLVDTGH